MAEPAAPKDAEAFRTISEVASELDLPQHVLRFWETRFRQIKPMKRGGGRRFYRPEDVALLRGIRHLLYGEGYTIRGVQRILKEQGNRFVVEVGQTGVLPVQAAPPAEPVPREKTAASPRPPADLPSTAIGAAQPMLSEDQLTTLRSALGEMLECKRLLDQAR